MVKLYWKSLPQKSSFFWGRGFLEFGLFFFLRLSISYHIILKLKGNTDFNNNTGMNQNYQDFDTCTPCRSKTDETLMLETNLGPGNRESQRTPSSNPQYTKSTVEIWKKKKPATTKEKYSSSGRSKHRLVASPMALQDLHVSSIEFGLLITKMNGRNGTAQLHRN